VKRDIGQEILDALREVKAGGGKRTIVNQRGNDMHKKVQVYKVNLGDDCNRYLTKSYMGYLVAFCERVEITEGQGFSYTVAIIEMPDGGFESVDLDNIKVIDDER